MTTPIGVDPLITSYRGFSVSFSPIDGSNCFRAKMINADLSMEFGGTVQSNGPVDSSVNESIRRHIDFELEGVEGAVADSTPRRHSRGYPRREPIGGDVTLHFKMPHVDRGYKTSDEILCSAISVESVGTPIDGVMKLTLKGGHSVDILDNSVNRSELYRGHIDDTRRKRV